MTETRFDELINLYLDNEIGWSDLGELKHAIQENLVRRRKFERACELHQAARKALTAPSAEGRREGNGTPRQGSRASSTSRPSGGRARESAKSRQVQAHRNAATSVQARRQEQQGAARTLDLSSIDLGEDMATPVSAHGTPRNFSFFSSSLGLLAAFVLSVVVGVGVYFITRANSLGTGDDSGQMLEASPLKQLDGGYDPKAAAELAAEIKRRQAAASTGDAVRAGLYQTAFSGQSTGNSASVDYSSLSPDLSSTGNTTGNAVSTTPGPIPVNLTAGETNPPAADSSPPSQP